MEQVSKAGDLTQSASNSKGKDNREMKRTKVSEMGSLPPLESNSQNGIASALNSLGSCEMKVEVLQ